MRMSTSIDEIGRLQDIETGLRGHVMSEMLKAGGAVYARTWKEQISTNHHVKSGSMLQSVGMTEPQLTNDGGSISIYPLDVDSRGVRNAVKAFVLVNGKKSTRRGIYRRNQKTPDRRFKGNRPDKFVERAEDAAMAEADAEMQRVLDEFLRGGSNV